MNLDESEDLQLAEVLSLSLSDVEEQLKKENYILDSVIAISLKEAQEYRETEQEKALIHRRMERDFHTFCVGLSFEARLDALQSDATRMAQTGTLETGKLLEEKLAHVHSHIIKSRVGKTRKAELINKSRSVQGHLGKWYNPMRARELWQDFQTRLPF